VKMIFFSFLISQSLMASVQMPRIFSDHMVLQRERDVPLWGWATPGETLQIKLLKNQQLIEEGQTVATNKGEWSYKLRPRTAGGNYQLLVNGSSKLYYDDVTFGEVWLASGQSNMQMPLEETDAVEKALKNAKNPLLRFFNMQRDSAPNPLKDLTSGDWKNSTPEEAKKFSAVAYYFGLELTKKLQVPVGIVNASFPGSFIEAWIDTKTLETFPLIEEKLKKIPTIDLKDFISQKNKFFEDQASWEKLFSEMLEANKDIDWFLPQTDISSWQKMTLPNYLEKAGLPDYDGIVWFRKDVEIPQAWIGEELTLNLGPIDDEDTTWVNGNKVGEMHSWDLKREYKIAASQVVSKNISIVVRVLDSGQDGGIYGKPEEMKLMSKDGSSLSLAGNWKYTLGVKAKELATRPKKPLYVDDSSAYSGTFNAMISPLIKYPFKGVIWYQGESNASQSAAYPDFFSAMLNNWRNLQGNPELAFLFVQLANCGKRDIEPVLKSNWALLREAQDSCLKIPQTAQALAYDTGDGDLHPKNKQPVGHRLALLAQKNVYNFSVNVESPRFDKMEIEGRVIRLRFLHVEKGLTFLETNKPTAFAIAGEDKKFYWTTPTLLNNEIMLKNEAVLNPVAVRYAWGNNPEASYLYNSEGLPLVPFRTDHWNDLP